MELEKILSAQDQAAKQDIEVAKEATEQMLMYFEQRQQLLWPGSRDGHKSRHSGFNSLKVYATLKHMAPAIK